MEEPTNGPNLQQLFLPQPVEWQMKRTTSTHSAFSAVSAQANIDGVDMKFDATVITDAVLPGICLGTRNSVAATL